MGWLIALLVVGGIIWFFTAALATGNAIQAQRDAFLATHEGWDVYISAFSKNMIAIDQNSRRLALGSPDDPREFNWGQLASVEIERNGETLTQTNRGSQAMGAAIGGLLLGPAGLLLGGLTGSKRSAEKVKQLSLKVIVEDQAQPVHRVVFLDAPSGIKPDSEMLKPIVEAMEKHHALLSNAIRSEDREREKGNSAPAIEHQSETRIAQLWDLHQQGALTFEEYSEAKGRVLGGVALPLAPSGEAAS